LKLYDTRAEAIRVTTARNARSLHRTRGFWVAVPAGEPHNRPGYTVRWVSKPRSRRRLPTQPLI
jgi:hypothetical protein